MKPLITPHEIHDAPSETAFDDLTALASEMCSAPISVISLIDSDRQWFKAREGVEASQVPEDFAFRSHAIRQDGLFLIPDATQDARFKADPLVTGGLGIRFYAAVPLVTTQRLVLGTLCVMDRTARSLSHPQAAALLALARQATSLLELGRRNLELTAVVRESHRYASELSLTSSRLRALVQSLRAGLLTVGAGGKIIFANAQFCEMFGFLLPPDEMIGIDESVVNAKIRSLSQSPEQIGERMERMLGSREPVIAEEIAFANGDTLEFDYVPILMHGQYQGHLWTYREVSQRKQAEQTIARQRIQILESAKLTALGEMAGGLSHEINNPLAIIQGRIGHLRELAESGRLTDALAVEYCDKIAAVVTRMSRIIKGLRAFARDGDDDPLMEEPLGEIVRGTLEFCKERIRFHGVELRVGDIPETLRIHCRGVQVSQVLLNLINNAFDAVCAAPSASPWIAVEVRESEEWAEVRVVDSGPGIPKDIVEKLFDPFFTTKPVGKGSGLGLSISKGIVEAHGGTLRLEPDSAHTCFSVTLPKAARQSPQLAPG